MLTFNHKITLFVLATIFTVNAVAQNQIILWGSVDSISDVNIQIHKTNYGTSTNTFGEYSLAIFSSENSVDIQFSCIGYQDTIFSIDLRKAVADSIKLNVSLRKIDYQLNEVVIAALTYFIQLHGERIVDIEFLNSEILLLALKGNKSIVYIFDFNGTLMHKQIMTKKYTEIHKDCFDNLILVSKDSCLQIAYDKIDSCTYAIDKFSKRDFISKLKPCILEYHNHLLFTTLIEEKGNLYVDRYHHKKTEYFYSKNNQMQNDPIHLISFFDKEAYKVAQSYYGEIMRRYYMTTPENENIFEIGIWDGNILKLINDDNELFNLISWYQNIESRPIKIDVFIEKDTLIFFDRVNYQLIKYNQEWQQAKTNSIVENMNKFNNLKSIIQDNKTEDIYGIMENRGLHNVMKINTHNGSISTPLYTSTIPFPDIIEVYDNQAYVVYYDSYSKSSIIIRKKLF